MGLPPIPAPKLTQGASRAGFCISRNMRIQQHKMSLRMCLTNNIIPTSMGVNAFGTIVLLTLTTNCDGGALVTTQHTHFYLILSLVVCGGRVALVRP